MPFLWSPSDEVLDPPEFIWVCDNCWYTCCSHYMKDKCPCCGCDGWIAYTQAEE